MFFKKKCRSCGTANPRNAETCASCGASFHEAIRVNPQSAEAYYERGLELQRRGQEEQAIDYFNKAIRIDSQFAKAYRNRGYAYLNTKQYDLAIADNTKAAMFDPSDPVACLNLGVAHRLQGNSAEAIANFEKVISLSDNPQVVEMARQEIEGLSK